MKENQDFDKYFGVVPDKDRQREQPLQVQLLHNDAKVPFRASSNAAGYDLHACVSENMIIDPQERGCVPTGIIIAIPDGHYGRVAPRSGLAVKCIDTAAGVIDSDYRGEVKVILVNHGREPFVVKSGDRIAQLIIEKISNPEIVQVHSLSTTTRGVAGFGSTGVN